MEAELLEAQTQELMKLQEAIDEQWSQLEDQLTAEWSQLEYHLSVDRIEKERTEEAALRTIVDLKVLVEARDQNIRKLQEQVELQEVVRPVLMLGDDIQSCVTEDVRSVWRPEEEADTELQTAFVGVASVLPKDKDVTSETGGAPFNFASQAQRLDDESTSQMLNEFIARISDVDDGQAAPAIPETSPIRDKAILAANEKDRAEPFDDEDDDDLNDESIARLEEESAEILKEMAAIRASNATLRASLLQLDYAQEISENLFSKAAKTVW